MYYLYILECRDKTLYTGITTDLARRLKEHNTAPQGAKYTRVRRPVTLVYASRFKDRSSASKAEAKIKNLSRLQKISIINTTPMKWYKKQLEKLEKTSAAKKEKTEPTTKSKTPTIVPRTTSTRTVKPAYRSPVAESKLSRPKTDVR